MSAVATALTNLEEDQQDRVLRWAAERYGVTLAKGSGRRGGAGGGGADNEDGEDVTDDEIKAEAPVYEHFAELFSAAQPKTNEDKALVAAYWVQAIEGKDQWASRLLNVELKNLGHPIANITEALSSNMRKKPQRVIQLRKSGSSQQATKTYKVTHEGLVYVQGMLSRSDD
ncbi:hypothetical protein [Nocardioides sp. InS609-2]|uniref:hypothetical protein n=1 Tax=Nocardioides sp. InS609-2 TaxID=2760705 RepID=UPI0020C07161|nr:hypothetical protein [Nocardioides sp. InS609-2]